MRGPLDEHPAMANALTHLDKIVTVGLILLLAVEGLAA
jgi:hypothetical protein